MAKALWLNGGLLEIVTTALQSPHRRQRRQRRQRQRHRHRHRHRQPRPLRTRRGARQARTIRSCTPTDGWGRCMTTVMLWRPALTQASTHCLHISLCTRVQSITQQSSRGPGLCNQEVLYFTICLFRGPRDGGGSSILPLRASTHSTCARTTGRGSGSTKYWYLQTITAPIKWCRSLRILC